MQYKHYIKLNDDNEIIDYWSSGFRDDTDGVLLRETDYRKFYLEINGIKIYNPVLLNMDEMTFNYKYLNNEVVLHG